MATGSLVATYRVLAAIPSKAMVPGVGEVTAEYDHVRRGLEMLSNFPDDMDFYSHGMCQIELSVWIMPEVVPESDYTAHAGQQIILPTSLGSRVGKRDAYDGFVTMQPENLVVGTGYRGLGGTSSGTPYAWCKIGSDERAILCHEWGHAMTAYLSVVTGEYDNFPTCPPEPSMHCNDAYGFYSDIAPGWLEGFLSGTLPDGKGINATGWAVGTPTDKGVAEEVGYYERITPWGVLGPLNFP